MHRATIDDVTLEYDDEGTGDALVFIHAGLSADWFAPFVDEPALAGYRRVNYHRAGYAASSHPWGPVSIGDHARHCHALMQQLGIDRAHLVGHSSSALMALQLALDAPAAVRSLTLLEPALMPVPSRAAWGRATAIPAIEAYRAGDRAAAVDVFMRGVAGDEYRAALPPGAFERMVADAPTFFEQEFPAVAQWEFGEQDARRVTQPVLAVIGGLSKDVSPVWQERQALLLAWLPNVEPFVLEGATHMLHLQQPQAMAEALAAFLARHPVEARA